MRPAGHLPPAEARPLAPLTLHGKTLASQVLPGGLYRVTRAHHTAGLAGDQLRARCATVFAPPRDPRLPPPGTVLTRNREGTEHRILILDRGFEYHEQTYTSLGRLARTISGGRCTSGVNSFHLERLREGGEPKAPARPAEPAYPLGSLLAQLRDDLGQAGYGDGTITGYLGHLQRFANHHKRSPEDMGHVEILQYLDHLVEDRNVSLGHYRATCSALRACYRVSLGRPGAVGA